MSRTQTALQLIGDRFPIQVTRLEVVGHDEVRCVVTPEALPQLASLLSTSCGAHLRLMVAEDERRAQGRFLVHYLFANAADRWFTQTTLHVPADDPCIPSLALLSYPASRFEREIADLFGIAATGHPDPRPLVRHGFWPLDYFPLRRDAVRPEFRDDGQPFPFGEVQGLGVYEIPVGPVHAGIIEPGHFRFSVLGETVIDLKARLYFTHKGTEKLFENRTLEEGVALAERISGDSSVAHALAYCQAVEKAAGVLVPRRAEYIRVVLLELERIYNHINDFGAIANDTGFAVAHAHCLRLRERLFRLNKSITGSRLLRGGVRIGGTSIDLPAGVDLSGEVAAIVADFEEIVAITMANTLVLDRLRGTGVLSYEIARDHGVLGYVARASGLDADVRRDHPFAAYDRLAFEVPVLTAGDVEARALIRVAEVREAMRLIRQAIAEMPAGELALDPGAFEPSIPQFLFVEGWRGAIAHWISIDERRRLRRVKVVDPSFLNWRPLSYAVLDNIVPDFPLCNKSFNQSYSGNDL
jgi:Ni,Fe-hydrogenase III large subunit/Ni,Fe-hydrogenase III component G